MILLPEIYIWPTEVVFWGDAFLGYCLVKFFSGVNFCHEMSCVYVKHGAFCLRNTQFCYFPFHFQADHDGSHVSFAQKFQIQETHFLRSVVVSFLLLYYLAAEVGSQLGGNIIWGGGQVGNNSGDRWVIKRANSNSGRCNALSCGIGFPDLHPKWAD